MEGYRYIDLFATKGIEYLLVIGFLLALILFWRFLNRRVTPAPVSAPPARRAAPSPWFYLADGIFYHPGHTWAAPENGDVVRVGIDDFAQKLVGRPRAVVLPRVGSRVEQGEIGWKVQVDSIPIDLLSPVDGEVVAVNDEVLRCPDLMNQDPYGKGWLIKVRVSKLKTNLRNLLSGRLARAWMEETVEALRRRMDGQLGMVLQDGGLPVDGIARNLSPDNWDEIVKEFLLTK